MRINTKRITSLAIALLMIIACVCANFVPVHAAVSYQGQGTKASPYLVETAAQLDGMRNNLSAHYKLANTIDLASFGAFTPIGYQGERFTGTFTCDKNSDGTPKYVIKNLKVYNDAGEKFGHQVGKASSYVDYVAGKNKWQAGLFGWTDGATIENIAILNADITNTVLGQNQMNSDFSLNPEQDAMGTGVLIGCADSTTVIGCMASGAINSKTNHTGGLIGIIRGGSVSYSYSTATVNSTGLWGIGGLVGTCKADLSCCYATGNVMGAGQDSNNGGLVGSLSDTSLLVSCYSTGNVGPENKAYSLIGAQSETLLQKVMQNVMNCYTTSNVAGRSQVDASKTIEGNNNFILSSSTGKQDHFKAASMSEIKAALASTGDYDVSGSTPVLSGIAVVPDAAKYVPGQVSDVANSATNDATNGQENTSDTQGESSTESTYTAEEVANMITQLPESFDVTLKNKEDVKAAKRAYDALAPEQKMEVSNDLIEKLNELHKEIILLISENLTKEIPKLPKVKKLTADDYDKVMELYDDFQYIGEENQEYIDEDLKSKLLEAVKAVEKFKSDGSHVVGNDTISPSELMLIIVLSVLIVLTIAFNIIWSIIIIKRMNNLKK